MYNGDRTQCRWLYKPGGAMQQKAFYKCIRKMKLYFLHFLQLDLA